MQLSIFSGIAALSAWNFSLLLFLAKTTVILGAALALTLTLRRASAGARHTVWLVTLGALLIVPAVTAWVPLRIAVLPPAATDVAPSVGAAAASPLVTSSPNTPGVPSDDVAASDAPRAGALGVLSEMSAVSIALIVWGAGLALIVIGLAWAAFSVRRIVARSRPLDSPEWQGPLCEIADRLELADVPRLMQSDDARMPFACGLFSPTIVLPVDADGWTLERRRAVLLHELAHVRRRDLLGHTLGRLACAVYWFQPLVWTAAKQLRAESERACDDLALACGTRPADYAEHLLDIVTSVRGNGTPVVALAMARRNEFEGRMLAILDPELRRTALARWQSVMLVASLALAVFVIGAASPVRREANAASVATPTTAQTSMPTTDAPRRDALPAPIAAPAATPSPAPIELSKTTSSIAVDRIALAKPEDAELQQKADDRPALLAKVLSTDANADLRRTAAWGLQEYANRPFVSSALAAALRKDSDASVREMSAWSLSSAHGADGGVTDALAAALRGDANAKVRATSAWSLGSLHDRGTVAPLAAALADADRSVRMRAAWAIGTIRPKQAPAALTSLLGDGDADTRMLAAWALYSIADPATAPAIKAALKSEKDANVSVAYVRAIASMGEAGVDVLRDLLESTDPAVKSMAVRALAGGNATGPWPFPWPEPRPFP